jgi:hypothetical protein
MKRRFKDPKMQEMYETCRVTGLDKTGEFWWNGKPLRGAGHRSAYWNGYDGQPSRYLRNSLAYAAWAAGQDNEKAGR